MLTSRLNARFFAPGVTLTVFAVGMYGSIGGLIMAAQVSRIGCIVEVEALEVVPRKDEEYGAYSTCFGAQSLPHLRRR